MEMVAGARDSSDLASILQFLNQTTVLPLTSSSSQQAYQLMESYYLSHGLLIPDALIAATALENNLPLYTKNMRHFRMIGGLTVVRPY